ncbi:hypothetical protein DFH06DRAFT_1480224 [Mycena polygramma]|nr:hypothetical protein DFH06DRAFT_1480224 [Mycena polygramma]
MLATLEADRIRVAELQTQILQLERSLSELRIQHSQAQQRLNSYRYPVLTLPPEIVSEIFIHFLPTYPGFPPLAGTLSPTLLTQICRRWREIALETPALRRAIGLSNNVVGFPWNLQAEQFDIWLERSRACPLALSLTCIGDDWAAAERIATVVPHRARWEYLEFYGSILHLRALGEGTMPLLRHLDLTLNIYYLDDVASKLAFFREAPLLRTVIINNTAAARVILPWTQLTSLTFLPAYLDECVPFLQQTSNLVHCELFVAKGLGELGLQTQVVLPYLESLTMIAEGGEDNFGRTYIPENWVACALQRLTVPETFLDPEPVNSMAVFISRLGCNLKEMHITGRREVSKKSYHEAFPSIREFSFDTEDSASESESDLSSGGSSFESE